jgi:glycosyl hydrolase family 44
MAASSHLGRMVFAYVLFCAAEASCLGGSAARGADVNFSINSTVGVHSISPYIYGANQFNTSIPPVNLGLQRLGGNRWTGYNWETNYSNAGTDYLNHSDLYLTNGQVLPPGGAITPALQAAATRGNALLVTMPIAGYVAADASGTVSAAEVAPSNRWKEVVAKKSSLAGQPSLSTTPNPNDPYVFTDEFAYWLKNTKQPSQQLFYDLDNEPGLWDDTHPRIHPNKATFAELRDKTIANASAIKDVDPTAKIFGPGGFGWSDFVDLNGAPDSNAMQPPNTGTGKLHFQQWLLQEVAAEEARQHRTLLDVLDMHWYPEARGGGVRITAEGALNNTAAVAAARVQAPRSLWDPTYTESSWITDCCSGGPIQLLNRVQSDINQYKPGTKMAITEYNYGGGNDISGAIAEADALGIFGKKDLYAAAWWSIEGEGNANYTFAAFDMFRNYDGSGSHFGDMAVDATTNNNANSAVYASVDANNPNRMTVVAINRTNQPLSAAIAIADDNRFTLAQVYQLTSALAGSVRGADLSVGAGNQFMYLMPAMSVTTLVLTTLPGDYNADGTVNPADYTLWRKKLGSGTSLPNGDDTPGVGPDDYARWRAHFGQSAAGAGLGAGGASRVPEASTVFLLLSGAQAALGSAIGGRRRRAETQTHLVPARRRKGSRRCRGHRCC